MPFLALDYPTLGIPLLQSILKSKNIDCSVFYFAERFKDICTQQVYDFILDESVNSELGEWFFSHKTFQLENDEYLNKEYSKQISFFLKTRNQFEHLIDDLSDKNWSKFKTIGFSCTFLQLMPSLCLSKEIKKKHPSVEIIFGGGNMTAEVSEEVLKNCSWVDKVFVGESENSLPYYLESSKTDINGIMWKNKNNIMFSGKARLERPEIHNLPVPDYDDFYKTSSYEKKLIIQIGRGCIYNKCNFCVFCDHSAYRKGSVENSMAQLKHLIDKHKINDVCFIDLIMPPGAYKHLPKISGQYSFCISSFTWSYNQLPYLKNNQCVLGLESFHPEMLKLLDKEQSIIECISIIKWLKHYKCDVIYLLLYGAFNENPKWYSETLPLMRMLTHLPFPSEFQPITHFRDNTYLTDQDFKEHPSYKHLFPSSFDLTKIARIFKTNDAAVCAKQIQNLNNYVSPLMSFIKLWKTNYINNSTCLRRHNNTVLDTRQIKPIRIKLTTSQINILEFCDYPVSVEKLNDQDAKDIKKLLKHNLLLHMEDKYLNLVEPTSPLEEPKWANAEFPNIES